MPRCAAFWNWPSQVLAQPRIQQELVQRLRAPVNSTSPLALTGEAKGKTDG